MKGSTLHRSGLTREKMGVLASLSSTTDKRQNTKTQLNQYYKTQKAQELDILWGNAQRGLQKVHNATKATYKKSPAVYLTIGFIAGVLFMCAIFLIVSICSMNPKASTRVPSETSVAVIGEDTPSTEVAAEETITKEKYVVKQGDTLNGIAYRFYGKYDEAKILEIQKINNITNPAAINIGQELIIPVSSQVR